MINIIKSNDDSKDTEHLKNYYTKILNELKIHNQTRKLKKIFIIGGFDND